MRHSSTAASNSSPCGTCARPRMYSKVMSSGAIMPARPPPSMDMLQTVIRPSMDRERITSPVYSMTWPVAPATPILPMMLSTTSFAVTPAGSLPFTRISIVLGLNWRRVCVASTCSTSDVPMPIANAPNAPCVGCVAVAAHDDLARLRVALLRPYDMHDALKRAEPVVQRDAELFAIPVQRVQLRLCDWVGDGPGEFPCGRVVVRGCDSQFGAAHLAPCHSQPVERLRRCNFVNQMKVNIEDSRLPRLLRELHGCPKFFSNIVFGICLQTSQFCNLFGTLVRAALAAALISLFTLSFPHPNICARHPATLPVIPAQAGIQSRKASPVFFIRARQMLWIPAPRSGSGTCFAGMTGEEGTGMTKNVAGYEIGTSSVGRMSSVAIRRFSAFMYAFALATMMSVSEPRPM